MSIYETNLLALEFINSPLNHFLKNIPEEIDYEVFMKDNAFDTLNLVNKKTSKALYEGFAQDTVAEQAQSFEAFTKYPYLYFFGLGNGVFFKYLLQNEQHKRLIVIEPDIQILYVVLHIIDFSEDIKAGRALFLLLSELTPPLALEIFSEVNVQRYARVYDLHVMCEYYKKCFASKIQETNRMLIEGLNHSVTIAGNDTKDALIGLKQHITNLPKVVQTPTLISLLKSMTPANVAVLVSTGPSLSKQLPLLKSIAPYVRIFAVDASLPVLAKAGIKPDVVTSIERVALSARFFEDTPKEAFKNVIFTLSSLQHKRVLESIKGGTKLITLRPLGYMRATGPDLWGYVGIGMSSANMAYEIIYHSHFKTCILIGQDLAYSEDGSSHTKGHVFGEKDTKEKEGDGYTVAYGGKGKVKTTNIWNMMRGFIEKDIAETSERMQTINATEGGARIFGSIEMPFTTAIKKYIHKKSKKDTLNLNPLSLEQIKKITLETEKKVDTIHKYIKTIYMEVESLFLKVAKVNERVEAKDNISIVELEEIIKDIKTFRKHEDEELYENVVWHIAQSMMLVQDMKIAPMYLQIDEDETRKKENLINLLKAYKSWLFSLAGILDAITKTINYARARRLIDEVEVIGVYIGNECIDTFTCKDLKPQKGRVFDVDMRGILYDTPDEYQDNIYDIVFKNKANNEKLSKAFVSVIDRDDEKYNEFSFIKSLEEPIDEEKIKDLYCKDAIGFLATEKNLEDSSFIEFVKLLKEKNYGVPFVAFCFEVSQRQKILEFFGEDTEIVIPKNIEDILTRVNVYLYSMVKKDSYLFTDIGIRNNIIKKFPKIFVIDLEQQIDSGEFIDNISLAKADITIDFSRSVVSKILQGHKKFNEFSFMNSLVQPINKLTAKSLNPVKTLGCLVTDKAAKDSYFVDFSQKIIQRFSSHAIKLFYFHENDLKKLLSMYSQKFENIEPIKLSNIESIISSGVDVWLDTNESGHSKIKTVLLDNMSDVYIATISSRHQISLKEYDKRNQNHPVFKNLSYFGLSSQDLENSNGSLSVLVTSNYIDTQKIDFNASTYEFLLLQIECALESYEYVMHMRKWINLNQKYKLIKGDK